MNEMSLKDFTYGAIKEYTKEVVENRAVPELKDGLKPVQRKILWAMYKIGLMHNLSYKKSAKVAGDVMGKYSPHGDCYQAIVNLSQANKKYNLVDGQGNWGNYDGSPAAASRYTECRLSKIAELCLLDKDYLNVVPYMDNYDGSEKEPVYLPARLPFVLLLGVSGIAVATRVGIPVFNLKPLIECIIKYIKTDVLDVSELNLTHLYGGIDITEKQDFENYLNSGTGVLTYAPKYNVFSDRIEVTGLQDNFDFNKTIEDLDNMPEVKNVADEGSNSIKLVIYLKDKSKDSINKILKKLSTKFVTATNILNRVSRDEIIANYKEINVKTIIKNWSKYRLFIEEKCLLNLISEKKVEIKYQELLLKASNNLKIIFKSLESDDSLKYLIDNLKVTEDEANTLLDLQIKRLNRLNSEKTQQTLDKKNEELNELNCKYKNIKDTVIKDLTYLMKEFCK